MRKKQNRGKRSRFAKRYGVKTNGRTDTTEFITFVANAVNNYMSYVANLGKRCELFFFILAFIFRQITRNIRLRNARIILLNRL